MTKLIIYHLNIAVLILTLLSINGCEFLEDKDLILFSPNGELSIELIIDEEAGTVHYTSKLDQLEYNILNKSQLGIELNSGDYFSGLKLNNVERGKDRIEEYHMLSGKKSHVKEYYNSSKFIFSNKDNNGFIIEFRVFNDGFSFRYEIPGNKMHNDTLITDKTTFFLPGNGKAWLQPYDLVSKWTPGYERIFTNGSPIGQNAPDSSNGWCFPMLFEQEDSWLLITESGLDNNNCGMHIDHDCSGGIYKMAFPAETETFGVCRSNPGIDLPWLSSWRVVIAGRKLDKIYESNLVTNLSEQSKSNNTEWIKPGRAAWSWWSESDSPQSYYKQKRYIDFAAEMNWEYSLVDANWNLMKGGNIEQLAEYAASKNVGLLLWYNSGGPHNVVDEDPRDKMHIREIRRKEFEWMKRNGIKGIKVDFFQSDKKCIIQLYHEILSDALDYNLLVNFHGCTMPRGWNRTYPNLLTMEAVRGGEVYKFGDTFPEEAPIMNTIYAFTRNVVGSMDYTPVMFSDHTYPHITTYSHELATAIVFESGITHFADNYESYLSQSEHVIDFLKNIEVSWEESKFLYGYPGKEIAIARKKENKWYVGGLNSESVNKEIEISLDFLPDGEFKTFIFKDGNNGKEISFIETTYNRNDNIQLEMLPYGGFTLELNLLKEE